MGDDAVDAVTVWMETVIAELEVGDQEDDQTGGQADGEAQDIDHGVDFVLPQFAHGDEPVIF